MQKKDGFMKAKNWIVITGVGWLAIGCMLMTKGIKYLAIAKMSAVSSDLCMILTFLGLILGYLKGKFIFSKTVDRLISRIYTIKGSITLLNVYPVSYWLIMVGMSFMGVFIKALPLNIEFLGMIDLAIGSALVNGAMLYFRKSSVKLS